MSRLKNKQIDSRQRLSLKVPKFVIGLCSNIYKIHAKFFVIAG